MLECYLMKYIVGIASTANESSWRNRLARSTVNRKVGGSSPPEDGFLSTNY